MTLTIGNWVLTGIVGVIGAGWAYSQYDKYDKKPSIIIGATTVVVCVGLLFGFNWYNTSTASGVRYYKDFQSEMENGIDREIVITAEDGREIFRYEGKVDLDMDHEGNYLRFETQDGKRYTIEYGVQDSVIVIEK